MDKPSKLVQDWFRYSRQDLNAARVLFETKNPSFWSNVGFLCQQSAEKSIKGLLTFRKIPFTKTHDIKVLAKLILEIYPELKNLLILANDLTPFAVEFRYPDASKKEMEINDIQEAITIAENVYQEMTNKIPFGSLPIIHD